MHRFTLSALVLFLSLSALGAQTPDRTAYDLTGLGTQVSAYTTQEALVKLTMTPDTTTVLYFAATWCPSCQAFYRDLKVRFATLPKDVNLVFVNYDRFGDVKKLYGVTSQHTFVTLDAQGGKKMLWVGGSTVMDLLKKLGKA